MSRTTPKHEANYHHGDLARALIAAAEAILSEEGLEGFTLRECARRAGVSHAAPAHHFGDARGLLTAVAATGFEQLATKMREARDAAQADERLDAIGMAYIEFALSRPAVFRLMFHSDRIDSKNGRFAVANQSAFALLRNTIETREVISETNRGNIESALLRAWSIVHGFAMLALDGQLGAFDKKSRPTFLALAGGVLNADLTEEPRATGKSRRKVARKI